MSQVKYYIIFILLLLTLAANARASAAPVTAPKKAFETYCNAQIGVILFISESGDIAVVPMKDTRIKTCKDVP